MDEETGSPQDGGPDSALGEQAPLAQPVPGELPPRPRASFLHTAVIVGVVAMAIAGLFAFRSLRSAEGANSPEDAVRHLFEAVAAEDVLATLEALAPEERDLLKGRVVEIGRELGRLGVLAGGLDLSRIAGLDASFEGLRFSSEEVADGLAGVRIVGGTSRLAVRPGELPLGGFMRDVAGSWLRTTPAPQTGDLSGVGGLVAAVRRDGRWYVSLWYSVAENARRDAGAPVPALGRGITARGAPSPEGAVEDLLRAAAALDVRRLIELMPPDEAAALHDYAPLFINDVEGAAAQARGQFRARISSLGLSSRAAGDEALVKIDRIAFQVEGADGSSIASYDGRCLRVAEGMVFPFMPGNVVCEDSRPPLPPVPEALGRKADLGIVVVRRGGLWYVSPTRTWLDGMLAMLRVLRPRDLEQVRDFVREFAPGFAAQPASPEPRR
ncbi:MAG: hypothetical protein HY775_03210 [Acidobacteria bacterium]|nr:hypothetical protein [Acidobacteriota bacterium]